MPPVPATPAVPRIRPMTEADAAAVAEVRVRSWQSTYRGLIPQSYLDAMSVADETERQRRFVTADGNGCESLVAEDADGTVTGWAYLGPYRKDEGESAALDADGELYAIYLRPEHVGRGVGRTLAETVVARCEARGFPWLRLWVLEGNETARRFYERVGFAADDLVVPFTVDGVDVPEVRYSMRLPRP
jgi:GNAT superfamily N-acetyltransferase